MKNALVLHGTNGHSQENWFPWLKAKLEEHGYTVWVPDLPGSDKPNPRRYNKFLLENESFVLDAESVLIGHSSGAVAILALLQALPKSVVVDTCILVGAFKDDLGWEALHEMFTDPLDFEKTRRQDNYPRALHPNYSHLCSICGGCG